MTFVFLAEGFEEIEALTTVDILRRAGMEVTTVGVGGDLVKGAHGIPVQCDLPESQTVPTAAEMVVIPGGMPGVANLDKSPVLKEFIHKTLEGGGYLAAICAGPSILGGMGLLKGRKATCYPGFEQYLTGADLSEEYVVQDGPFITGKGPGVSMEFALRLAQLLWEKKGGAYEASFAQMKADLQCRS